ncbi:PLP-dependent aminotransferase family protein [Thermococcus sp. 9N3]|uniref:aminotransferase-like domain-containing protein n=1 Tax=Thermococcus sp. 9N3 TaxID=163002 RepID=UPI00143006E7|nr:PLP-dependent aminotransferase family protein [Thermococcus sp. 9N3]NJE48028.1 PLP-dependent aminotransferase family protein [Thermococcus sp. 9N3]
MFSRRIQNVDTSALRRVLSLISGGEVISFAGGVPSPELFPMEELRELVAEASENPLAFQYSSTLGLKELRDEIARYMERWGVRTSADEIMVTHGSQQGIDAVARTFVNPGDVVIVEAPTYFVALNTFQIYEPDFQQVPLDGEGIDIERLEDLLRRLKAEGKTVKLLYTVPTFQNPAGVTMSEGRRNALAELAEAYDFLIVEDNPYGELRYRGKAVKAVRAFAPDRTVYLGSFSKVFVPGFRIAWLNAPEELMERLEVAKQTADVCTNSFGQHVTLLFMKKGLLERQIERLREAYGPKMEAMLEALEEFMPENVEWTEPEGGMFVWLRTAKNTDELLEEAVKRGVAYVPGSAFYALDPRRDEMRLNFTFEQIDRIREGVRLLAELLT